MPILAQITQPELGAAAGTAPPSEGEALVAALIGLSPYRAVLLPLLADITRIARANRQIGTALAAVALRADFARTGRLRRADLGPDRTALLSFLEYIRFASPDFLRSVGEWPVGGMRERS